MKDSTQGFLLGVTAMLVCILLYACVVHGIGFYGGKKVQLRQVPAEKPADLLAQSTLK